jgi:hypothetical protein
MEIDIMSIESIKIWEFYDAPEEFQNMSISGGDEDWLVLIPPNYTTKYLPFLECEHFGCCSIDKIKIAEGNYKGYIVLIGTHS